MKDRIAFHQIGRSGPLSPDKVSHFKQLQQQTGIAYDEMVFFDDCNWGDHCGRVSKALGVVSQRTPHGMEVRFFRQALLDYRRIAQAR
mmetsp:Transcript_19628/g.52189  ORF Transcript_19628/g.52189 Transcript_19628/m.52189 type:complete len:88 (+) Transcript_19628:608-871(+)